MRSENLLLMGVAFLGGIAISNLQRKRKSSAVTKRFIDEALGMGMKGIQNARAAIQNSKSTNLQIFAQKIADDYGTFNQRLMDIARLDGIEISNIEKYQRAAKTSVINYSNAVEFDLNYLEQSKKFNDEMTNFLLRYTRIGNASLRDLISSALQHSRRHEQMTDELSQTLHTNSIPTSSTDLPADGSQKAINH